MAFNSRADYSKHKENVYYHAVIVRTGTFRLYVCNDGQHFRSAIVMLFEFKG